MPGDDRLPDLLFKPLPDGATEGNVPDIRMMIEEYYQFRSWDRINGRPSKKELDELGLSEIS